jgi:GTP cyclohydrolase IA
MDAIVQAFSKADERPSKDEAEEALRTLIRWAGDDPDREGLQDTPRRVTKAYRELFGGYDEPADDPLRRTFSDVGGYQDMVIVKGISFVSHCEHHMLPFHGHVHIGYQPAGRVLGLSKFARLVEIFARRLQTQETMTAQIAQSLDDGLRPLGVAVMVEAEHMCMSMRGVKKQGAATLTMTFKGEIRDSASLQARFLSEIRHS